jgi:hypothetical protein
MFMDVYGCLWIIMDVYGCVWMCIVVKVWFDGSTNSASQLIQLKMVVPLYSIYDTCIIV